MPLISYLVHPFQVQFCDVIFCNRYYAWYHDFGQTQLISKQVERELRDWFDAHGKPVVQAEYGADTVAGMHVVRAYKIDVTSFMFFYISR